ncbi:MAG: transglycosylase SLT domain-containing protein [Actinomycetota bacterium]|nr:transglycosylase SLT domain-containing protein [Actinomycetota bacterium]
MQEKNLIFGARARRSRRRARLGLAAWITSLIAAGGGAVTQVEEAPGAAMQGVVSLQSAFVAPESRPEPGPPSPPETASRKARNESGPRRSSPNRRPQPRPPSDPIEDAISSAAAEFGVDGDYLRSLAWCESDLDPNAYSSAGYYGLFQFDEKTWSEYGYGSIWDLEAQTRTTARLLAMGEDDRWPNCA